MGTIGNFPEGKEAGA